MDETKDFIESEIREYTRLINDAKNNIYIREIQLKRCREILNNYESMVAELQNKLNHLNN